MTSFDLDTSLAWWAATQPGAWRVLLRHGLVFCCTAQSLRAACAAAELDPQVILDELVAAASLRRSTEGWEDRPLADLVEHIQSAYHGPLIESLSFLSQLAEQVVSVHGPQTTDLRDLAQAIALMRAELLFHLDKEESVLFPWILSDGGRTAMQNIRVLILEHKEANGYLVRIRQLTDDFRAPSSVTCGAWQALYRGLAEFDAELHEHIYLEDDVLFTRVLAAAI